MATQLGLPADAIVVNVQGDEPLIPPAIIDQVAANLAANPQAGIATLAEPIEDVTALFNPNVVKVVTDKNGLALTFSRAPLAWARDAFARAATCCRPACLIAVISASTPTEPVSCMTSSPGGRAGWKTPNAWSNCARCTTACVSMLPMRWRHRRLAWMPPKTWSGYVTCWGPDEGSVRAWATSAARPRPGVLRHKLRAAGLDDRVQVDSAGTGDWHVGKAPDSRTRQAALRRGYDLSAQRARQVEAADFQRFDLILAMDQSNLRNLKALRERCPRCRPRSLSAPI